MRGVYTSVFASLLVLGAITAFAFSNEIEIVVSPNTLVFGSQGEYVTVHAEIPYSSVDRSSVELNGIEPLSTKPDSRGDLVAKFDLEYVKEMITPGSDTLTLILTGLADDGPFVGTDTVGMVDLAGYAVLNAFDLEQFVKVMKDHQNCERDSSP